MITPTAAHLLLRRFAPNAQPMLKKCFEFDPPKRINLPEVQPVEPVEPDDDIPRSNMPFLGQKITPRSFIWVWGRC